MIAFIAAWRGWFAMTPKPDLVRVAEFICENNRDYSSLFEEQ